MLLTSSAKDAQIASLLPLADAVMRRYTKRELTEAEYTEFHSGSGRSTLVLRNRPVLTPEAVTDVRVDLGGYFGQAPNAFPPSSIQTRGRDWALKLDQSGVGTSGLLVRLSTPFSTYGRGTLWGGFAGSIWQMGVGNIRVTYTAGYPANAIPDDLVLAGANLVSLMMRVGRVGVGSGTLTSESVGAYSYSLGNPTPGEPPEITTARQLLSNYREQAV